MDPKLINDDWQYIPTRRRRAATTRLLRKHVTCRQCMSTPAGTSSRLREFRRWIPVQYSEPTIQFFIVFPCSIFTSIHFLEAVKRCQRVSKIDKDCQKLSKAVKNCQKLSKIIKDCQNACQNFYPCWTSHLFTTVHKTHLFHLMLI